MIIRILVLCLFLSGVNQTAGAIVPLENSTIHYNSVYFEETCVDQATEYELFLYHDSLADIPGRLIFSSKNRLPAFWVSDLEWGKKYSWKIKVYGKNQSELAPGKLHIFNIQPISVRGEQILLDVKTNKEDKHAKGLLCLDYARSIFDRNGKPVWTLPGILGIVNTVDQIRNLDVTKDNTIIFLTGKIPVEIDVHGRVLWQGPENFVFGKDTLVYHHDFKKTNRGTYMVLANRSVFRKILGVDKPGGGREKETRIINGVPHKRAKADILVEFDKNGKLLWYWDANDYITDEDLNEIKNSGGLVKFSSHANAFSENEEGTKVYIGFRNLSRIIKIDKKTKKVELTYGEKFPSGDAKFGNGLFKYQHDANVTNHNSIIIFNNFVTREERGESSIMELRDNVTNNDSVLVWKFDLKFDTLSDGRSLSQGNVVELPNSNLLLCAGVLNRVFEVTKNKEVVWDAFIMQQDKRTKAWKPFPHYRCNWTAQLKDHHFIPLQPSPASIQNGSLKMEISLNNTGNADDSYLIEIYSGNKLVHKVKTTNVEKGKELMQAISVKLPAGSKNLEAKISSLSSPLAVKMPIK